MSTALAIATVTASLKEWLFAEISGKIGDDNNFSVTYSRPDLMNSGDPLLNIFLYRVSENPGWKNCDLPMRGANLGLSKRPRTALDLHYLFSVDSKESPENAHAILGYLVRILHSQSTLPVKWIWDTVAKNADYPILGVSRLFQQQEIVKLHRQDLTIDDLQKLWSMFPDTPYRLSVAYTATTVVIEADEAPEPAPPIAAFGTRVAPFGEPILQKVSFDRTGADPAVPKARLLLDGSNLQFAGATLHLGDKAEFDLDDAELRPRGLAVPWPEYRAGTYEVWVSYESAWGIPETKRSVNSNSLSLVVQPTLTEIKPIAGGKVKLTFASALLPGDKVVLILTQVIAGALKTGRFEAEIDAQSPSVEVPVASPAGVYLARCQVNGVESLFTGSAEDWQENRTVELP